MRQLWPEPGEITDLDELVAAAARPTPADRPWLLVNMIASLDGAIDVAGRSAGLGRPADRAMFRALRAVGDVVMAGAGTMRTEGYGPPRPSAATRASRRERGQAEAPRLAVVSRRLELDPAAPMFAEAEAPPYVLTCESSPSDRRRQLAAVAEVLVAGDEQVDLAGALAALRQQGVATICCEGGPSLNGELLLADLVDEWALTVSPLLVGGTSIRSVVGPELAEPRATELTWLLEGDGLLLGRWLRARSEPG